MAIFMLIVCMFFDVRVSSAMNLEHNSSDTRLALLEYETSNVLPASLENAVGAGYKIDNTFALPLLASVFILLFGLGFFYALRDYLHTKRRVFRYFPRTAHTPELIATFQKR